MSVGIPVLLPLWFGSIALWFEWFCVGFLFDLYFISFFFALSLDDLWLELERRFAGGFLGVERLESV